MVVCVEAGLGLGATFKRVAVEFKNTSPIIAREFESTILETQAGRGLMDALRGLADRTGVQELRLLISLVIQTDRFGTPMVETLRAQGDAIRLERMQRAEEMAQKAPVKMTFPAGLIFLAVLMILGGPAMIMLRGVFPE
jgi:tight adherence protein C